MTRYEQPPCSAMPIYKGSAPTRMIPVPLTRQATSYTCGVAALQSVLGYYCIDIRQDVLAEKLKSTPAQGTSCKRILSYARELGFSAQMVSNISVDTLKELIDTGITPILMIQAWAEEGTDYCEEWEAGHYVVACGYNSRNIFFMDPSTLGNYTYLPIPQLLQRWHDEDDNERYCRGAILIINQKISCRYNPTEIKYLG